MRMRLGLVAWRTDISKRADGPFPRVDDELSIGERLRHSVCQAVEVGEHRVEGSFVAA